MKVKFMRTYAGGVRIQTSVILYLYDDTINSNQVSCEMIVSFLLL